MNLTGRQWEAERFPPDLCLLFGNQSQQSEVILITDWAQNPKRKGFGSRRWRKSSPAMQSDCRDFLNSEAGSLLHASQIRAAPPTEACVDTSGVTFKIQCRPWTFEWYCKCNLYILYNHCKWQGDFSYLLYPNNSQVCWCNLGQFVTAWKDWEQRNSGWLSRESSTKFKIYCPKNNSKQVWTTTACGEFHDCSAVKGTDEKKSRTSTLRIHSWPWLQLTCTSVTAIICRNATVNTEYLWYITNQEVEISLWEPINYAD